MHWWSKKKSAGQYCGCCAGVFECTDAPTTRCFEPILMLLYASVELSALLEKRHLPMSIIIKSRNKIKSVFVMQIIYELYSILWCGEKEAGKSNFSGYDAVNICYIYIGPPKSIIRLQTVLYLYRYIRLRKFLNFFLVLINFRI